MDDFNIADSLVQKGVSRDMADQIENHINGSDLINLTNALQTDDIKEINSIISKFGVSISESLIRELDDKNTSDAILSKVGYTSEIKIDQDETDKLMDYLDDKGIDYITDGMGTFNIKCPDRDILYKLNRYLENFHSKIIRDRKNIMTTKNKMNEGIMGMTSIQPLGRLMELAGIPSDTVVPTSDDMDGPVVTSIPDDGEEIEDITGTDDYSDMDTPAVDDSAIITPDENSPAMNEILDYLNNIQSKIPDIKLCEYKTLSIKLQDLSSQAQAMVKGYIGERQLRK